MALLGGAAALPWAATADDEADEERSGEGAGEVRQLESPEEILERYPAFTVPDRVPVLEDNGYYPCSDCHAEGDQEPNPEVRELVDDHEDIDGVTHGGGRFWCLTCHHEMERDELVDLKGNPVSMNQSFLICGQCHFDIQRDTFFGSHGKRLSGWKDEREIETCVGCHDPHVPAYPAMKPLAPPKVRTGLARESGHREPPAAIWDVFRAARGWPETVVDDESAETEMRDEGETGEDSP